MKGYLKLECIDNGLSCTTHIEEAGILGRYHILSVVCDALEIDDVLLHAFVLMGRNIIKKETEQIKFDMSKLGGDGE